jgi:xylulokinase
MATTPQVLAGIDIGTSGAKSVLIDSDGKLLAWAGQEYPLDAPHPEWAEQNPQVWLDAAQNTLRQCLQESGLAPAQVAAIGLTGQMHSLVCLDESGAPLRPAIIWADRRSRPQVQALTAQFGRHNLGAWTGNPLATGFMLASWAWLCQEEPHTAARTRWLLLPKDEVRYRMTGQIGSEPSDASSTLLFDPHSRTWSQPVLDRVGLSLDRLPAIHESAEVAGGLLPDFARACGLLSGTPVVYGCSDQAAQAFSQGVIRPGLVSCTIGTGGQVFAPAARPVHDPGLRLHLFCHAMPGVWHLESAILSAGLALRWLRDQVWPGSNYNDLADAAAGVEAADEGLFFLPYLAGERTPHMDSSVRAAFAGLSLQHTRPHMVRAAMEGVVFALKQGLDLMLDLGVPLDRLVVSGGGTRHPLWLQLQADIFGRPVYPSQAAEATGRGAALLAGIGVGIFKDAHEAVARTVKLGLAPVQPRPEAVERYAAAYPRFCALYPGLQAAGFAALPYKS